jgi:serine/threonine protein phosphatase PrpC
VEALLASGHITGEQAAAHPMRNVLYRALGQVEETQADLYSRALDPGDTLLLCSDGLTRHVSPQELAATVAAHPRPDEAARALVKAANQGGGEDNISVVVIRMERAKDAPAVQPQAPAVYDDTDVGLFQAPLDGDLGRDTLELPTWREDDDEPPTANS